MPDLRLALRTLVKTPVVTIIALLSLALGTTAGAMPLSETSAPSA